MTLHECVQFVLSMSHLEANIYTAGICKSCRVINFFDFIIYLLKGWLHYLHIPGVFKSEPLRCGSSCGNLAAKASLTKQKQI